LVTASAFNSKGEYFPFASTRYYGSKRRQVTWLSERLLALSPSSILDPMGGTGTISHAMSVLGIPVTYGDIFAFNVESARGLFEPVDVDLALIDYLIDSVRPLSGMISRKFQGLFFTDVENNWLDGFMHATLPNAGTARNILFYAVVQACLKKRPYNLFHRSNLYMRLADVNRSFGNLVTWQKSFALHIKESVREALMVSSSLVAPITIANPFDVLQHSGEYGLVYLDPPYFHASRFSDSYMRRYHFLEGLASYETWESKINDESPIREFKKELHPLEWTSGQDVLNGIEEVAKRYLNAKIVVSYVADQSPSVSQIENTLRKYRRHVSRCSIPAHTALSTNPRRELMFTATN
jgi:adenine-specific DNA-methyltransferase